MVKVLPSSFLVYDGNEIKVTDNFKEVRHLIDFTPCSRKDLPSVLLDGPVKENSKGCV